MQNGMTVEKKNLGKNQYQMGILKRITSAIDPIVFLITFALGLFYFQSIEPTKIVVKYPTQADFSDLYQDQAGNCWTYDMTHVPCTDDSQEIPVSGNSFQIN